MIRPDLHMHTTCSDGVLAPEELVNRAAAAGVTLAAITDHDAMDGALSLKGKALPIPVITGVELSMADMHGLHLLGYGLGEGTELHRVIRTLADNRRTRARRMVEKLCGMGYSLDYDEICARCCGSVGRLHIARALVERGYVRDVEDAFGTLIGNDGPAYVAAERLTMAEALPLMRRSGFVPVLAHPAELKKDDMTLRMLLESWQKQGLMGVEVYHPSMLGRGFAPMERMVRRMGLLVTGGSDYHTDGDSHGRLGCMVPHWRTAGEDVQALTAAMEAATAKNS